MGLFFSTFERPVTGQHTTFDPRYLIEQRITGLS